MSRIKIEPIVADPKFVRDNQYSTSYKVICEDYHNEMFNMFLEVYGSKKLSKFPSGKKCFFCKIDYLDENTTFLSEKSFDNLKEVLDNPPTEATPVLKGLMSSKRLSVKGE